MEHAKLIWLEMFKWQNQDMFASVHIIKVTYRFPMILRCFHILTVNIVWKSFLKIRGRHLSRSSQTYKSSRR